MPHKFTKMQSGPMTNVISPTEFKLEFCNPLTFGQMWISWASWASTGWNMTQKNLLFIHDSWRTPSPLIAILHLIGREILPLPPHPPPPSKTANLDNPYDYARVHHRNLVIRYNFPNNVQFHNLIFSNMTFPIRSCVFLIFKQKLKNYCLIFNSNILAGKTKPTLFHLIYG